MIFEILGKEPKFWTAPVAVFDVIIGDSLVHHSYEYSY